MLLPGAPAMGRGLESRAGSGVEDQTVASTGGWFLLTVGGLVCSCPGFACDSLWNFSASLVFLPSAKLG